MAISAAPSADYAAVVKSTFKIKNAQTLVLKTYVPPTKPAVSPT